MSGYESQNKNWYGLENEKEKADEKTNTTGGKTRWYLTYSTLLGVFGSLISGAAGIAKAINDNKAAQCQLKELKRHYRELNVVEFLTRSVQAWMRSYNGENKNC